MIGALWRGVVALVRSGQWRTVRSKHLELEPVCQACLKDDELEVHHCTPVHAGGSELDPENLITFCHDCHFVIGHACNWHSWRPEVKQVAKFIRESKVENHGR